MADVKIAVVNRSTVVKDDDVAKLTVALQRQVTRDFAPVWGCPADLRFVPGGKDPGPGEWWLVVLDNSDQAGALGYHQMTNAGLPISLAFAKSAMEAKSNWTVTVSHELLEMLADPNINLTVFDQGPIGARLYAYEVCDPCEADQFGYEIDGFLLSDFVYPTWFEYFWKPGSAQFDQTRHITKPFELLTGGYIGINDFASGFGWYQLEPEGARNAQAIPFQGSRRQRRTVPPRMRLPSDA